MRKITITLSIISLFYGFINQSIAQSPVKRYDTLSKKGTDSVSVSIYLKNSALKYLPDVIGTSVYAGKKTNQVSPDPTRVDLSQNLTRTAFAQIPGLTMWDMDGAGTQVNVGSRGTDSHRSIEMNMRQNGYNTNSDVFGYPENHYTPPMQGIQRMELVRGSAALQFGSQFGGMMNYTMREGDSTKPLQVESEQTAGSYNFFNSYNAVGGTSCKLNYYAYYDYRHGDGWRPNAAFNYHAYYVNLNYKFNNKVSLAFQFSRMSYVQQISGGLTDAQFNQNSRQSIRSRNFFNPEINIAALLFKYQLAANTKLEITAHSLFGQRNSVQFIASPLIADTINTSLKSYNARQVDRDYYNAFTTEARLLHQYQIGSVKSTLASGIRFSTEITKRRQKGVGTTGSDYDLSLIKPYGIDLHFTTRNYALFAENIFQLTSRFSVTPGFRNEITNSDLTGKIINATVDVAYKGKRNFPLFGTGLQYELNKYSQLYGNVSQAYRPFLYANVTPADRVDVIDPNLKDSRGYDIDLGYRGHFRDILNFDVNGFYVFYGNRAGLITQKRIDETSYLLTTNVGDAVSKGLEAYVEVSLLKPTYKRSTGNDIRIFSSLSYTHARYVKGAINNSGTNTDITGNYLENVPDWMNKTGLTLQHRRVTTTLQFSYTSKNFNDAFNTVTSSDGVTGLIPAYHLWDWSVNVQFSKAFHISGTINNLCNEKYFNRRITMYPGPGILPADGRTFNITLGVKI